MLKFLKRKSKTALAIDIGSCHTKIMDVSLAGSEITVQSFSIKKTPAGCFDSGSILDEERLTEFLAKSITEISSDKTEVISGVTGKGFMTKKISIPKMEHHLISEHLPFEAEQYIPYEISDVDLDYELLKGFDTSDQSQLSLFLIVVLRKTVAQYSSLFDKAHLSCSILDANVFALANAFEANYNLDDDVLLMDIGSKNTNLSVLSKKQVIFTRNLGIGSEFFTKKIQEHLGISFEDAEGLKIRASSETEEGVPEDLRALMKDLNRLFCEEIYADYSFYLNFFPENKTTRAFITGGGSQIKGLTTDLEERLSFPVSLMSLFEKVNISPELETGMKDWEKFSAVCIGLALRNIKA